MIVHFAAMVVLAAGLHAQAPSGRTSPSSPRPLPSTGPLACDRPAFDCAILLIERGDFSGAVATLEKALAGTPRDLKMLNLLGIALSSAGRTKEANDRFHQALALDSAFHPARKNLAVNHFNAGRLDEAEPLFRAVLAQVPADEVAHLHLAEIHYARKQPDLALPHYEKSGARTASTPAWTLHYASCLLERGDHAQAVRLLDRLPQDDGASRFEAGVALGRAGAHADAARHFGAARSTYKDAYAAGYNQTLMLIEAADYAQAIRVAEELLRANHRTGELYNLVSRAYAASDRIQEAYDALRTAARLEPSQEQHYVDLALICLDHENFDLGMEIVGVGLQYKPDSSRLHLYRGVLLVMKGMVEQAEHEFQLAQRLGPDVSVPYVALAMAWMQSGNTSRAVELLRRRLTSGARDAIVPYMLGIALMRSGVDPADDAASEAIDAFEEAIRLDPALAGARAELGKVLLGRGETQKAIEHLEQAASLDPDNPAPAYLLAQAYRRTGQTDRARALLARVTKLNAQGRGDISDKELKRIVVRLVREGTTAPSTR